MRNNGLVHLLIALENIRYLVDELFPDDIEAEYPRGRNHTGVKVWHSGRKLVVKGVIVESITK